MYNGLLKVPEDALTEDELERIKAELTIINPVYESKLRHSKWKPREEEKYLYFWHYKNNHYYFPRNILKALNISCSDVQTNKKPGEFADIIFSPKLRDYQKQFLNQVGINTWIYDKIFEVPCGHGKTIIALYLASIFKKKTLVLVTTNYLAKQWQQRAKEFCGEEARLLNSKLSITKLSTLPNISIVTLSMYNNLQDTISQLIKKEVGFVVMDEGHRSGAESYQSIIETLPAKKRLCLTATFRRLDGKEKILQYHFGEKHTMQNQQPLAKVYPLETNCTIDYLIPRDKIKDEDRFVDAMIDSKCFKLIKATDEFFNITYVKKFAWEGKSHMLDKIPEMDLHGRDKKLLTDILSKITFAHYDNYIAKDGKRIRILKNAIQKCLKDGRTILVLSKRKNLLHQLDRIFSKTSVKKALIISETNKMKQEERDYVQNEAELILGINQLAQEGFDVARIDTVIFCHPITDTEQAIGRSGRVLPGKKQAIVLYLVDNCWVYRNMFRKSINFIKINAKLKGDITISELDDVLWQN